jgi:hypothetical protein
MDKFTRLTGVAAPLPIDNVDTDMIIPKQYLKTIKRTGLGAGLFAEMRYREDGSEHPDFVLNKPAYRKASILVAGDNFGCGSSREHAPWALLDFGVRQKVLSMTILSTCFMLHLAHAQSTFGDLRGTTRDPSGLALAQATVTVHSLDANTDRSVISGDDGSFVVENLQSGHYQLTAAKAGFQRSSATRIELSARQSLRVDLTLATARREPLDRRSNRPHRFARAPAGARTYRQKGAADGA